MTDPLVRLLSRSRQRGFLGPGPVEAHIEHALAYTAALEADPSRALDLGAGGGVPGLVLAALAWPATSWCLLEANQRRAAFLLEAVQSLGLADRVEVVAQRAETAGRAPFRRHRYRVVVARSFGPPSVTAECGAPFLAADGVLVVSEPPAVQRGVRWPPAGLADLGLGPPQAVDAGQGTTLTALPRTKACPSRYPRRAGIPAKRPLF